VGKGSPVSRQAILATSAYLALRESILNLIQHLHRWRIYCLIQTSKASGNHATTLCFLQQSSALPGPRVGGVGVGIGLEVTAGLVTQLSAPKSNALGEGGLSLHPAAGFKTPR